MVKVWWCTKIRPGGQDRAILGLEHLLESIVPSVTQDPIPRDLAHERRIAECPNQSLKCNCLG